MGYKSPDHKYIITWTDFELIDGFILHMRYYLGTKAIQIAQSISGLTVDRTGYIQKIKRNPAEIVALLTIEYEKQISGKKSMGALEQAIKELDKEAKTRVEEDITRTRVKRIQEKISIIKKYFAR